MRKNEENARRKTSEIVHGVRQLVADARRFGLSAYNINAEELGKYEVVIRKINIKLDEFVVWLDALQDRYDN